MKYAIAPALQRQLTLDLSTHEPSMVAAALRQHSCALLKSAAPTEALIELRDKAACIFNEYSAIQTQEDVPEGVPYSAAQKMANVSMIDANKGSLRFDFILSLRLSPVWNVITSFFGTDRVLCLVPLCSLRLVDPGEPTYGVPFHQDGFALPEDPNYDMLSAWCLLDPEVCGPDAPTVKFIVSGLRENLPMASSDAKVSYRHAAIDPGTIDALFSQGASVWSPEVQRGDVLLFHRYNAHATEITTDHRLTRLSVELRFLPWNAKTESLFRERKNPVIRFSGCRATIPREIRWSEGTVREETIYWPPRVASVRGFLSRFFDRHKAVRVTG